MRSFLTVSACTAALLVLSACSATDAPEAPQAPQTPAAIAMDREQLLEDMRILAADDMEGREAGTEGSARARAYLIERFEEAGIEMIGETYESPFTYRMRVDTGEEQNGINLIGRIEGTGDSDHTMVVSAHYDHVGMRDGEIWNGADDNASGVAAMLAVAADFAANPPEHDVIFAALDAEERGLQGAYHFVANPPVDREDITFNLNLDMVAMSEDRILWAVGTYHYPFLVPVVEAVAARASVNLPMGYDEPTDVPGGDWTLLTDSGAFHRAGIPFIYLGVDFHPHYHQPTDTYDNMTLEFFQDASETIIDFAREADANLAMIAAAGGE